MAIEGRTPEACYDRFQAHIQGLVSSVFDIPPYIRLRWTSKGGVRATLEYVRGDGIGTCLPIESDYGKVYLTFRQYLQAVPKDSGFELQTIGYSYRLLDEDRPTADAQIRWEYVGDDLASNAFCRHHVQFAARVSLNEVVVDLNRQHTPTGWVTIEEVLRFVLFELRAKAKTSDWYDVLRDSEKKFYEEFTTRRYRGSRFRGIFGGKK